MRARPSYLVCAFVGLGAGLVAFGCESALVLRSSAIGLEVEQTGPFAALMEAVRPQLPGLFARIAAVYAVAGAGCGLLAGAVARLWRLRRRRVAGLVALLNGAALLGLLMVDRAVVRPALFDDVPAFAGLLRWLVEEGHPWQPRAAAGVLFGAQVLGATWRGWARLRRQPWQAAGLAMQAALVLGLGTQLWANTLAQTAAGSGPPTVGSATPRLILLFGIDAFRPDRLSAFGADGSVAPNLEALLAESTLFTNAWTPIAQTEPAWRSLLTARWPHRTGVRYPLTAESRWLPGATFAESLSEQDWNTTFATDCSRFNYQPAGAGFAVRHQPPRGAINFVLEKLRYRLLGTFADNALGAWWVSELIDNRALAGLHDPAGYAQRLADDVVASAASAPSLYAFHGTAAHFPGDRSYPFHRAKVRKDAPLTRRVRMFFSPISSAGARKKDDGTWTRADAEALYDALLMQADAQLGEVIGALRRHGLYEDAAIIVFSDHGESFHEDVPALAGATSVHGARLQELENRILLAVKLPRGGAGQPPRIDSLVRLIDLGPTIIELAGGRPLTKADGSSLLPLIRGVPEAPRLLYAETGFTHASPAAFDPAHLASAPRSFEIYRVRPDGVVEVRPEIHEAILKEKDVGAFDGARWLIRSPRADGRIEERCAGACPAPAALRAFLEERLELPRVSALGP